MSALSNVALAMAISVVACSESPVVPRQASNSSGPETPLSAPTDLRAALVGTAGGVVISWTGSGGGFLVERALDPAGPWSVHGFTRAHNIGDALSADQRYCYRVAAVGSRSVLNSPASATLCITRDAQGVLTSASNEIGSFPSALDGSLDRLALQLEGEPRSRGA